MPPLLLGTGIAAAAVSLNLAAGQEAAAEEKGAAFGAVETVRNTAGALAVAALAAITLAPAGRPVSGSYQAAFAAAATLTAAAAAATALSYRHTLFRQSAMDTTRGAPAGQHPAAPDGGDVRTRQ